MELSSGLGKTLPVASACCTSTKLKTNACFWSLLLCEDSRCLWKTQSAMAVRKSAVGKTCTASIRLLHSAALLAIVLIR